MDLKNKFKTLVKQLENNIGDQLRTTDQTNQLNLNVETPHLPSDCKLDYLKRQLLPIIASYERQKEIRETEQSPHVHNAQLEEEILKSIDRIHFKDTNEKEFDASAHVLSRLPENLDLGFILGEKKCLDKQLQVVTKRVSDLLLKHEHAYGAELAKAVAVQKSLTSAINLCGGSRKALCTARNDLTKSSLTIVANYKRRDVLRRLLEELQTIKSLQQCTNTLKDMIEFDEDYPEAIRTCTLCIKKAHTMNDYKCVSDIAKRLQITAEAIEQQISCTLGKISENFNADTYEKLQASFTALGKREKALDTLLIKFLTHIHEKSLAIVYGYVRLFSEMDQGEENDLNSKKTFEELCAMISPESLIACLTDLNKTYWQFMVNYKRIVAWHKNANKIADNYENKSDMEQPYDVELENKKLIEGSKRIWQEIEKKLRIFVQTTDLSRYSFDDYIFILHVIRKQIEIGTEFSGLESEQLEDTLKKATIDYFYTFHRNKMDELRVYLETEIWALFPVRITFAITQLHEFKFLRDKSNFARILQSPRKAASSLYFDTITLESTDPEFPFDNMEEDEEDSESVLTSKEQNDITSSNLILDEESQVSNQVDSHEDHKVPIVTNSTLSISRIIGKYMQIMCILNQISFDVLLCIFHLFDYYLYGVYLFFTYEMSSLCSASIPLNLRNALRRIENNIIILDPQNEFSCDQKTKYLPPNLNEMVDLQKKERLYGLAERAIAVESLAFLAEELTSVYGSLMALIPEDQRSWLEKYFTYTVSVASDLRTPTYMLVASKCVQYEQILQSMEKVNWEVKEIMSQHNVYVDELIRELQIFSMRQSEIVKKQMGCKLPTQANQILWVQLCRLANKTFIEGFSLAKRCTPEGRALMQLDYQQFLSKMDKMVSIRPLPDKELVNEYIKAYYYTEDQLEQLIRSKKDYTSKQLKSLVSCVLIDNKKARQRLHAIIDVDQ